MVSDAQAQRRAELRRLIEKHDARAVEYRARQASAETQGKGKQAESYATTAARSERIALTHRQEIDRIEIRSRQLSREGLSAVQRTAEMEKARQRAEAAAAARPAIDPLQAYEEALRIAVELDTSATLQAQKAKRYARAGDAKRAQIASGGADDFHGRAADWRAEAARIQAHTERDLGRELAVALKARARQDGKARKASGRLADLGVESNLATAAAQREIASGGRGRGKAIASLRDYASLIRRPQDRTQARLDTMRDFDDLCGTADSGLFPPPKFEAESTGVSGPGATVMANRAAGLQELAQITAAIGAVNVAMLRAWIFERQTLTALVRAGYGTERTAGALCLAALDALAVYIRTRNALAARVEPFQGEAARKAESILRRSVDAAQDPRNRQKSANP
jgi:hypothetical protein